MPITALYPKKIRDFCVTNLPAYKGSHFDTNILRKPFLDIEIGAGVGLHAIRYCQNNLNRHLIAIERTRDKFLKLERRLKNHPNITNLTIIQADATLWIPQFLTENSVDNYFILYPNPYPKPKQANQRWVNMPFMKHLISTLKPEGKVTLTTNKKYYAEEALTGFTEYWNLNCIENKTLDKNFSPRTHFEKKYLARNEICYNLIFKNY